MNLVQIQENLKDLPTQAIMAYANGRNPEVPPYMALSELNRRKSMEQRATQPPTQSVKDKLESQVGQPPQGQQAPQGQPQGAPMPQGPQGIAQLPGAQAGQPMPPGAPPAPQGAPPAPQGMAGGGLAGLPIPEQMFNYAPGGIVAFAKGNLVMGPGGELVEEEDAGEDEAMANMSNLMQGPPTPPAPGLQAASEAILARQVAGQTNIPQVMSPAQAKEEAIRQNPQLAPILNSLPGSAITDLIKKLGEQDAAGKEKFKEGEGRLGLAGLSNALIAAGEATRGHKGMALGEAFGGFGKSYGKYTEESVKRGQAQQTLERQYQIESAKLQGDVDSLQRAYANNDVNGIMNYNKAVAERQARIEGIQTAAANAGVDLGLKRETLATTRSHYAATEAQSKAQLEEAKRQHEAQRGQWSAQTAHQSRMAKIAEESKPSKEVKELGIIDTKINTNPDYKKYVAMQKDTLIGSPEFNQIQNILDQIIKKTYEKYGYEAPEKVVAPELATPPEEPSNWNPLNWNLKKSPKPVSFSDLPQ